MLSHELPTLAPLPDLENRLYDHSCNHLRTWLRFLSCGRLIENEIRSRLRREFNTTLPRYDLMAHLEKHPEGVKMSDLSKSLMVTNGNITGITDQLVKEGLVQRTKRPQDRRSSILKLTAKGLVQLAEISAAHNEWVCSVFGELPDQTIQQMLGALDELKVHSHAFTNASTHQADKSELI